MQFTIYSKVGCPYCTKIEKIFSLINADYEVLKLDEDFNRDEFKEKFGNYAGFPQIVLNEGEKLGGCIDTIKYLRENRLVNQ